MLNFLLVTSIYGRGSSSWALFKFRFARSTARTIFLEALLFVTIVCQLEGHSPLHIGLKYERRDGCLLPLSSNWAVSRQSCIDLSVVRNVKICHCQFEYRSLWRARNCWKWSRHEHENEIPIYHLSDMVVRPKRCSWISVLASRRASTNITIWIVFRVPLTTTAYGFVHLCGFIFGTVRLHKQVCTQTSIRIWHNWHLSTPSYYKLSPTPSHVAEFFPHPLRTLARNACAKMHGGEEQFDATYMHIMFIGPTRAQRTSI